MIIQKGRPAQPPVRRYPSQETDRAFMIAYGGDIPARRQTGHL